MNKLFVHHPLFRLLSPLFIGAMVYLLILLINNNIDQLKETFIGEELYICIGLAYLIQESARLSLFLFNRINQPARIFFRVLIQVFFSLLVSWILVTISMKTYFHYVLNYSPNNNELLIFNGLFSMITLIYASVYISHHYMHKVNITRKEEEENKLKHVEADFIDFKKGINPSLLFDSLETMLVLMKDDPENAEELSELFSLVYRYLLSQRTHELIQIQEEVDIVDTFIKMYTYLPFQKIDLVYDINESFNIVPGSLLVLLERIIRSCICVPDTMLSITLEVSNDHLHMRYIHQEKLRNNLNQADLEDINRKYSFYSESLVTISVSNDIKTISIPKLTIDESCHN